VRGQLDVVVGDSVSEGVLRMSSNSCLEYASKSHEVADAESWLL
jgi:hypothetical protein